MASSINRRIFIGIATTMAAAASQFHIVAAQPHSTPADLPLGDVYTFLVLGLDTRPNETELNTDVIMVSRVNLAERTVRTMSIPRDLLVDIPGAGPNKINAAFKSAAANGKDEWMKGMASAVAAVENAFGLSIDATLSVRFEGVENIIDTFGGVTFNNPYDLRDEKFAKRPDGTLAVDYAAGEHQINGEQALQLMRTRNQDGDDGRVMRQQIILTALLEKAKDPVNLTKLPELLTTLRDSVITDIPLEVQVQLVAAVPTIPTENVYWGTMTHLLWGGTTASGMWVYQADWTQLPGYVQAFLAGEV